MDAGGVESDYFVMGLDIFAYLAVEVLQFRVMLEAEAVAFCKLAVLVKR